MPPHQTRSPAASTSSSLLAPGVAARLALASAALVLLPALAWTAARAGKLDGELFVSNTQKQTNALASLFSTSFLKTRLTNKKKKKSALVSPLLGGAAAAGGGTATPLDDSRRLVLAGGAAVVAVNLVMLLYVLSAFAEGGRRSGEGGGGGGSGERRGGAEAKKTK